MTSTEVPPHLRLIRGGTADEPHEDTTTTTSETGGRDEHLIAIMVKARRICQESAQWDEVLWPGGRAATSC